MIDIPEERILKEITDILMNDLPKVLLELEEQSEDSIRLPPFRYVGVPEKLPPGTGLPYALVEIEAGEYSEKDRIVKNAIYTVKFTPKLSDFSLIWRYFIAIKTTLAPSSFQFCRSVVKNVSKSGVFSFQVQIY